MADEAIQAELRDVWASLVELTEVVNELRADLATIGAAVDGGDAAREQIRAELTRHSSDIDFLNAVTSVVAQWVERRNHVRTAVLICSQDGAGAAIEHLRQVSGYTPPDEVAT